jgi:hypothetical protein
VLLVLTNSADHTADYLLGKLTTEYVRLDTDKLHEHTIITYDQRPLIHTPDRTYTPDLITTIWYRRPTPLRVTVSDDAAENRHASNEWGAALEGFLAHVPVDRWMNHPTNNAAASAKIEQLTRATRLGLAVPDTIVTQDPERARDFITRHERVITKPLSDGYVERPSGTDTLIYTSAITDDALMHLHLVARAPTLLQARVNKTRDVRITIIDDKAYAVAIHRPDARGEQAVDVRADDMAGAAYEHVTMPRGIENALQELVTSYHLRFAAIDMSIDNDGRWWFFELNPNGQWAWLDIVGEQHLWELFENSFQKSRTESRGFFSGCA